MAFVTDPLPARVVTEPLPTLPDCGGEGGWVWGSIAHGSGGYLEVRGVGGDGQPGLASRVFVYAPHPGGVFDLSLLPRAHFLPPPMPFLPTPHLRFTFWGTIGDLPCLNRL